jgi:hypothetical protein
MPKAIDFHVHLPTPSFLAGAIKPYLEATEKYFRTTVPLRAIEEVAATYESLDVVAVLLAWDAETATGLPPVTNDEVASIVNRYPNRFVGFASVDPWKGRRAIVEIERAISDLGLSGAKFHPSLQAFYPHDRRFYPLYETITRLAVPALFHTGTSGLGAGTPGGMGIKLDYSRPIYLDHVAADFPELTIVAAHTGWPWHEELLAIVSQKANVYMDLSGWLPRYIPSVIWDHARSRVQDKVLFGSDYPFILPDRWIMDFEKIERLSPEVKQKILYATAARILQRK